MRGKCSEHTDSVTQNQEKHHTPKVFAEMREKETPPPSALAITNSTLGGLQGVHNTPSRSRPNSEVNYDEAPEYDWDGFSRRRNLSLSDDVFKVLATLTCEEQFSFLCYRFEQRYGRTFEEAQQSCEAAVGFLEQAAMSSNGPHEPLAEKTASTNEGGPAVPVLDTESGPSTAKFQDAVATPEAVAKIEPQRSTATKKISEGNPLQISRYLDEMDVVGFDHLKLNGAYENAAIKWEKGVYNVDFMKLEGINFTANRKGLKPWTEVVTGFQGGGNLISALIAYEITVPNSWILFVYLADIDVENPDSLNGWWKFRAISPLFKAKSVEILVCASSVRGVVHITGLGYSPIRLSLLPGAWEYCATDFHKNTNPGLHNDIGMRLVALSITKSRNIPKNWATRVTSFKGGTSREDFIIIPWQVLTKFDQKLMRSEEMIFAARSCDASNGDVKNNFLSSIHHIGQYVSCIMQHGDGDNAKMEASVACQFQNIGMKGENEFDYLYTKKSMYLLEL